MMATDLVSAHSHGRTSTPSISSRDMGQTLSPDHAIFFELFSRSDLGVAVKGADGRYMHVNPAFAALTGRSVDTALGLTDEALFEANELIGLRAADQAAWQQTGVFSNEQRLLQAGQRRDFLVLRAPLPATQTDAAKKLVCIWKDLSSTRRLSQELEHALKQLEQQQQAVEALRRESQDAVVGDDSGALYQRAQFDEQLRREVDLSSREHREFALVFIWVDPFSAAVQAQGDIAQTRVLEALARLLRSNTRAMDASCRLEQNRFAVLLSGVGLATAHSRMEGLRRQCATQIVALNGQALGFTVSMGVASFPHTAHSEEELLRAADSALQDARRRGGNHVTLASIRFEGGGA
jgi:diguanylate cyclase (GGDEF)-like protein